MAMHLVDVTALTILEGYHVRLTFSDGTTKDLDVEPYLNGPIFAPVRNPAYFRQAQIVDGAVFWPNGADIDTQVLRYWFYPAFMDITKRKVVPRRFPATGALRFAIRVTTYTCNPD